MYNTKNKGIISVLLLSVLVLLLGCILLQVNGEKTINYEEYNVQVLGSKQIDSVIKQSKSLIIFFYSKSKEADKLLKIFLTTSQSSQEEGSDKVFSIIDLEKNHNIKQKFEIKDPFTIIYYKNGLEVSEFNHAPTLSNFKAFVENPLNLPTQPKIGAWGISSLVHFVNDRNAPSLIRNRDKVLMMFYSPNCGHCERMKPAFAEASIEVQKKGVGVFAAVDCTSANTFCSKFKVNGYPTLILFENGKETKHYNGDRSTKDLIRWFENPAEPSHSQKQEL